MTEQKMIPEQPKPSPELKRLDVFLGTWNTEWNVTDDEGKPLTLHGTDTYEWMPGGFFLLHRVNVDMGGYDYNVTEIIGTYNAESQTYTARSFDSTGIEIVRSVHVHDSVWTFDSDTQRSEMKFSSDRKTIFSEWKKSEDGANWQPWMKMKLTKSS